MTTSPGAAVGDKYVLPTGKADAARLDVIHAVYGPLSVKGLEAAAIGKARRAADIGCGNGTVSRWMATQMTLDTRVDAIDIAPEQIEVAKNTPAEADSAKIHYQVGSAYEPGLPGGTFDVVFCRLVLCHLKEPDKAVVEMAKLLRPGGRLVLVDLDLRDVFTMPHSEHYDGFLRECVFPYQTKIGVNYSTGLRLPELMKNAGLKTDFVVADQPIFRGGPEKHLWEKTFDFALQRAVAEGVITMERGQELIAGMEAHTVNPEVWVAVAKMFAAVGRKD